MTTCQVCGVENDDDNLIVLEGRRVCPACKPLVVQQLKEGCLPSMPTSAPIDLADHEFRFEELLRRAWVICLQDWPAIVGLKVMALIPTGLWLFLVAAPAQVVTRGLRRLATLPAFLDWMITILSILGVAWIVEARTQGHSLSFGHALGKAVRRWLPAIGTNLLLFLILGILTLLLIVPGIMFAVYFSFATYVVSLRGVAGTTALDYSRKLVNGRWWRVVGKLVGLSLPPLGFLMILNAAIRMAHLSPTWLLQLPFSFLSHVLYAYIQVGTALFFLNLDALPREIPASEGVMTSEAPIEQMPSGESQAKQDIY